MEDWTQEQYDAALAYCQILVSGCVDNFAVYDAKRRKRHCRLVEICLGRDRRAVEDWFYAQYSIEGWQDKLKFKSLDDAFSPVIPLDRKTSNSEIKDIALQLVMNLLELKEQMKVSSNI